MIRELEQVKLLLENINENLVQKTIESHDFRKKIPTLKQSKKEIEQEKILLKYISDFLIPDFKFKKSTDLKKKSKSLTQALKEIEQEKLVLNTINSHLVSKDSKYREILETLTTEFKTPLIPIKIYSKALLDGDFGELNSVQKEKLKNITKNTDSLLNMISELLVSKNTSKVKKKFSPDKFSGSLENIVTQNEEFKNQENILYFSENIKQCTVGIIDIVGSTNISVNLSEKNVENFYSIFINDMSNVIKKFEGIVVKNIGDSLLFYFQDSPKNSTKNPSQRSFEQAIKCGFAIIAHHEIINKKMSKLGLPKLDYKISFSFGGIRIAKISTSAVDDIFGLAVNICAKINSLCPPNSVVITQKIYDMIDSFDGLHFEKLCEFTLANLKEGIYLAKIGKI